jgi:predicted small secreted protein
MPAFRPRVVFPVALIAAFALIISACNEPTGIGRDLLGEGDLITALTDTFTIRTYTIAGDSTYATNLANNLIGSDDDAIFGRTTAGLYTQFVLPTNSLDFTPDTGSTVYIFDSLILSLSLTGFYGDDAVPQNISIYRMTEEMEFGTVYNADREFDIQPSRIGSKTGFLPQVGDSVNVGTDREPPQVRIPLDFTFGQELFNLAGEPELANDTSFQNWLPGLFIVADTMAGFSKGYFQVNPRNLVSRLNLYYRAIGTTRTDTNVVQFPIGTSSITVAHYTHQYASGSAVTQTCGGESDDSLVYIAGLGGQRMRIEIPHLEDLGSVAVNRAILRFALTGGSAADTVFTPPARCYVLDTDSLCGNQFIFIRRSDETYWSVLDQFESTGHYGGQQESIVVGPGQRITGYELNLTRQIQGILNGQVENDGFVLVPFPYFRVGNRAIIGGINHPDERLRMKLEILYTEIE